MLDYRTGRRAVKPRFARRKPVRLLPDAVDIDETAPRFDKAIDDEVENRRRR